MMQKVWWEKRGNTWWVNCKCKTWFPANEQIIHSTSVKMRCPRCKEEFFGKDAARLIDPQTT